jgi:hypothetical protein
MNTEDDKQRRKRRIQNKRRDRDRQPKDNRWWSPDVDKKPRRNKIDWSEFADDEDDHEDNNQ